MHLSTFLILGQTIHKLAQIMKKNSSILASLINDNNKKNFKLYDLFLFFFALILKGSFFKNFF